MRRVGTITTVLAATLVTAATVGAAEKMVFVEDGQPKLVRPQGLGWTSQDGALACGGTGNFLVAGKAVGTGDFHIRARLSLDRLQATAASLVIGANHFGFDGSDKKFFIEGMEFGQTRVLGDAEPFISAGKPFDVEVTRKGTAFSFRVDGQEVHQGTYQLGPVSAIGFRPWRATMRVREFSAEGDLLPLTDAAIAAMQQDHKQVRQQVTDPQGDPTRVDPAQRAALRMAIEDLQGEFPNRYARGAELLERLEQTEKPEQFAALRREALLANPLLDFERLLIVRRRSGSDASLFSRDWNFNYRTVAPCGHR